ncbi:acyl carrier protein [Nitrosomonas sp. sh817]|uniref:acyl carrier protein n=1 Tax=Nitrosomonas sp. sh817 TaxID=3070658 RepID=UPI0027DE7230|nr:acyl carrier protein [Nitrosomonas sp. sh817]WMJ07552.1 acyl carrier protein [Nitrosomonas sp. sh817]
MANSDQITIETKKILAEVLGLNERVNSIEQDTILLGNIPELDSVAVVAILLEIEKRFSMTIKDDEISARTFETFGNLVDFISKNSIKTECCHQDNLVS